MNPERGTEVNRTPEASAELAKIGRERLEDLAHNPETSHEKSPSERAEKARETLARHEQVTPKTEAVQDTAGSSRFTVRLDALVNYRHTLQSVQRRLDPVSRRFSQLIHNDSVDAVSEAAARTVGRPSVLTGALWGAVVIGGISYFVARHNGFALSGSEMLVSLLAGGVIGFVMEGAGKAFRRRR